MRPPTETIQQLAQEAGRLALTCKGTVSAAIDFLMKDLAQQEALMKLETKIVKNKWGGPEVVLSPKGHKYQRNIEANELAIRRIQSGFIKPYVPPLPKDLEMKEEAS